MDEFSVHYFHNSLRGAPYLTGTVGSLISVLDACLITGFGSVSVTNITVADGVATCTVNEGNSFESHHIVEISDASPSELNGRHRVLPGATNTTFEFETDASNGTATGTITAKYASVEGWEKPFSGDNKAVYRATTGHRMYYLVDDTVSSSYYAKIRGYEFMSGVDSAGNPFPPLGVTSTIIKSSSTSSTVSNRRAWVLAADGRLVMFANKPGIGSTHSSADDYAYSIRFFGEPISHAPGGDPWCSLMSSSRDSGADDYIMVGGSISYFNSVGLAIGDSYWAYAARSLSGVGPSFGLYAFGDGSGLYSGYSGCFGMAPSGVDGVIHLSPVHMGEVEGGVSGRRVTIPGAYFFPQAGIIDLIGPNNVLLPNNGPLEGRRILVLRGGDSLSSRTGQINLAGASGIDISGPWRDG